MFPFILESFALQPEFWIPLGTWISGARMSKAPSTGRFSHHGGRKTFLEEAGRGAPAAGGTAFRGSEAAGAGEQEACPGGVSVLHLSSHWSCRGPCPELHSETDHSWSYLFSPIYFLFHCQLHSTAIYPIFIYPKKH